MMHLSLRLCVLVLLTNVLMWAQSDTSSVRQNSPDPSATTPAAQSAGQTTQSAAFVLEPVTSLHIAYPSSLRDQKVGGKIKGSILVSESGEVEHVQTYGADSSLSKVVEDAAYGWKFKPIVVDGAGVPVIAGIVCDFALENPTDVVPVVATASGFPQHVRVSAGVTQGLLLHKESPSYPSDAKTNGIQGSVILAAIISKEGIVKDVTLVSGNPALAPAAIECVRRWRYRPYLLMGRPIEVQTQVTIIFQLRVQ